MTGPDNGLHPLVASMPELVRLDELASAAQNQYDEAMARNKALREGYRRASEQALLHGSDMPAVPTLVDESTLRHQLRERLAQVKRQRAEFLGRVREDVAGQLMARERELLDQVAALLPDLRAIADEITLLMRTMAQLGERNDAPLPRRIDVDELFHVAAAEKPLSFVDGYSRNRVAFA